MKPYSLLLSFMLVCSLAVIPTAGFGQSQAPVAQPTGAIAPSNPSTGQAAATPKANPVKVWTNDDIATMPHSHSTPRTGSQGINSVSTTSKPYRQEKDPAWYRKQLAPLNAEIDRLDPQIAKLKAFLSGEMVSDPPTMHRQLIPSPKDQLQQMEVKRDADASKIDDLLDRARHNGIEPGQLR
ncbi:MAG: hypothetical protein ABSA96_07420 [Candidatus Acidiferrales bacterium]|jgi:hypothetical protein